MTIQAGAVLYSSNAGIRFENIEIPTIQTRAPTANDVGWPLGKRWLDLNVAEYSLLGISTIGGLTTANWGLLGSTGSGTLDTLTADSGGAIAPVANNIAISGTGSEITTTGSAGTITLSIPATFIAPGTIASTTTLASGTSLAVGTSATVGTTLAVTGVTTLAGLTQVGTASINGSGAGAQTTTIGNVTGASAITMNVGTGNFALNGAATSTYTIGAATTTGTITIGGTAETGTITLGSSSGTNIVAIGAGTGATTVNIASGATNAKAVNIGNGAVASVTTIGSSTAGNITNLASAITALPGPVYIYTGAGAPATGLALHVGDLYINTTAASAVTRMYIATAASTWTNITCAA